MIITKSQKLSVLEGCHSDALGGGHFGMDKTFVKMTRDDYVYNQKSMQSYFFK